jgi:hypothetical protein
MAWEKTIGIKNTLETEVAVGRPDGVSSFLNICLAMKHWVSVSYLGEILFSVLKLCGPLRGSSFKRRKG